MKNLFLKEPSSEEIDTNGIVVASLIERTRSEMKTQRLINAMTTLAIGTTLGAADGFSSSERVISNFVVPAVFNGIMTLRSEVINR